MPRLARIVVYPVKSLDGVGVTESRFIAGGGLEHDRQFALRDASGKIVNGKRFLSIHRLRAVFDLAAGTVRLAAPDRTEAEFRLAAGEAALERWLGEFLGCEVKLDENRETGFPDDLDSPGPTIVGRPSLLAVTAWFPSLDLAEVRRRFRANLEITGEGDEDGAGELLANELGAGELKDGERGAAELGVDGTGILPPFWEDRLFDADAAPDALATKGFRIGEVRFEGTNPCARCAVPTRDSQSGDVWPRFAQEFQTRRAETLPDWAPRTAFDHFYRLSVNTRVPSSETGKRICVGDLVAELE